MRNFKNQGFGCQVTDTSAPQRQRKHHFPGIAFRAHEAKLLFLILRAITVPAWNALYESGIMRETKCRPTHAAAELLCALS